MIIVDTSVWIHVLKDKTKKTASLFRSITSGHIIVLNRFVQLELLQGAKNEREWQLLDKYLKTQYYIEASETTWRNSARIYFDLRRTGITLSSPIDCCIACIAIESGAILLHRDRDFEKIAKVVPLAQEFFNIEFQN